LGIIAIILSVNVGRRIEIKLANTCRHFHHHIGCGLSDT
jgi:hypothetical protein